MDEIKFKHTPEEARKAWVAALRSGEYKQGKQWLCTTDINDIPPEYCCLGVAVEVCMKLENGAGLTAVNNGITRQYIEASKGLIYSSVLPPTVVRWLGFDRANPSLGASEVNGTQCFTVTQTVLDKIPDTTDLRTTLPLLNDRHKLSFNDIADIIESEPPGLVSPAVDAK